MSELFSVVPQHSETVQGITPIQSRHANTAFSSDRIGLRELPLCGQFNLRIKPDNAEQMAIAASMLGGDLPTQVLTSVVHGDVRINWVAPDDWLVIMPWDQARTFEADYRAKQVGHYSIVDISGGQTLVELSGPAARAVLKKSTPVDVHPDAFAIGKTVGTAFAKSAASITRTDSDCYLLVIRRSFADYLWDWLLDASAEFRG
ncbi:sarcosine oxidase subunit gamma [Litorivicinus lipolyticus]|nr:sarcosine oxidase subunit gamma family protein [Litorivicinus lipolyticus]